MPMYDKCTGLRWYSRKVKPLRYLFTANQQEKLKESLTIDEPQHFNNQKLQ